MRVFLVTASDGKVWQVKALRDPSIVELWKIGCGATPRVADLSEVDLVTE